MSYTNKQGDADMYGIFRVMSGSANIGTYRAKNAKHAIQLAQAGQCQTAATFRKSQPAIILNGCTATMIEDGKGNKYSDPLGRF